MGTFQKRAIEPQSLLSTRTSKFCGSVGIPRTIVEIRLQLGAPQNLSHSSNGQVALEAGLGLAGKRLEEFRQ